MQFHGQFLQAWSKEKRKTWLTWKETKWRNHEEMARTGQLNWVRKSGDIPLQHQCRAWTDFSSIIQHLLLSCAEKGDALYFCKCCLSHGSSYVSSSPVKGDSFHISRSKNKKICISIWAIRRLAKTSSLFHLSLYYKTFIKKIFLQAVLDIFPLIFLIFCLKHENLTKLSYPELAGNASEQQQKNLQITIFCTKTLIIKAGIFH